MRQNLINSNAVTDVEVGLVGKRRNQEPRSRARNGGDGPSAAVGDDHGTPELRARQPVRTGRTVVNGEVRKVARTVDVLAAMRRNGTISPEMVRAGRRFQRLYHAAQLRGGGSSGLDTGVPRDRGRRFGAHPGVGDIDQALDARTELHHAVAMLGGHSSPGARAMWFVVGDGLSIRDHAQRTRWGPGRGMTEEVVRGVLIAGLAVLAAHWRID